MIIHGTRDSVVCLEDGEKLASRFKKEFLYEFYKIENGEHNDLYKNYKTKIYPKIRLYLSQISGINFNDISKIELEHYKKLHPSETKNNENDLLNNILIREFIEENNPQDNLESDKFEDCIEEIKNEDIILEIKNIEINKANIN
jgi:fermentation-respiration switch protein FrsA (DUF1100 family)